MCGFKRFLALLILIMIGMPVYAQSCTDNKLTQFSNNCTSVTNQGQCIQDSLSEHQSSYPNGANWIKCGTDNWWYGGCTSQAQCLGQAPTQTTNPVVTINAQISAPPSTQSGSCTSNKLSQFAQNCSSVISTNNCIQDTTPEHQTDYATSGNWIKCGADNWWYGGCPNETTCTGQSGANPPTVTVPATATPIQTVNCSVCDPIQWKCVSIKIQGATCTEPTCSLNSCKAPPASWKPSVVTCSHCSNYQCLNYSFTQTYSDQPCPTSCSSSTCQAPPPPPSPIAPPVSQPPEVPSSPLTPSDYTSIGYLVDANRNAYFGINPKIYLVSANNDKNDYLSNKFSQDARLHGLTGGTASGVRQYLTSSSWMLATATEDITSTISVCGGHNCQFWNLDNLTKNYSQGYISSLHKHETVHNLQGSNNSNLASNLWGSPTGADSPQMSLDNKAFRAIIEGYADIFGCGVADDITNITGCTNSYSNLRMFYRELGIWARNKNYFSTFELARQGFFDKYSELKSLYEQDGNRMNSLADKYHL